jgi:hypothetical protein
MAHNTRSIRLYERMGFSVEGRRSECLLIDGQFIDELTMAVLLPARQPPPNPPPPPRIPSPPRTPVLPTPPRIPPPTTPSSRAPTGLVQPRRAGSSSTGVPPVLL